MPLNHAWGVILAGTDDSSLVATATASWVMLAPCFSGALESVALPTLLGCTENTNSMVPRTPSCRSGRRVSVWSNGSRSHGGSTFGLIRVFRAGRSAQVSVLYLS